MMGNRIMRRGIAAGAGLLAAGALSLALASPAVVQAAPVSSTLSLTCVFGPG